MVARTVDGQGRQEAIRESVSHEYKHRPLNLLWPLNKGSGVSSFLLESAVEKLADAFVKGQLTIGDWSSAKGAEIQVCASQCDRLCMCMLKPTGEYTP